MTEEVTIVDNGWHLDRRVPITLIFTIVLQTIAVIWFLATLSVEADARDQQIEIIQNQLKTTQAVTAANTTAVAVLNANLSSINTTLERIEDKIDAQ